MDHKGGNSDEECSGGGGGGGKHKSNVLPLAGNERTMNLNPLILTNIQSSHYFKVNCYELKTYHEVVDEIYYKVNHLEPWEKGSRRTAGQTGMCGGVRGVGAGGIVSTAYCLLYKLFTLKLTRKQVKGLINHCDSPYIRALGFMYIRYTLPPKDLVEWYDDYLEDEEEVDVRAGGGQVMTIGTILRQWLVKLEWFSTLFPRIPVPIQQRIQEHLQERFPQQTVKAAAMPTDRPARGDLNRERPQEWRDRGNGNSNSREVREDVRKEFLRDDRRGGERDRRDRYESSSSRNEVDKKYRENISSYRERSPHTNSSRRSPYRDRRRDSSEREYSKSKKRHHHRDR